MDGMIDVCSCTTVSRHVQGNPTACCRANLPWDGKVSAELTDRSYNRFAENWENKKYTSHVLQFICSHLRFLTKMNQPGRSAATLPALGRVGPGIMRTVFLICAMNG